MPEATSGEVMIESAYRKLVSTIEDERTMLSRRRKVLEEQSLVQENQLREKKAEVERWEKDERIKIQAEWDELNAAKSKINVLVGKNDDKDLKIICSGKDFQEKYEGALDAVQGSLLHQMFSPNFIEKVPKDKEGRFILDFNPTCFGILIDWVKNKKISHSGVVPFPVVPNEQMGNMDILLENLNITTFMPDNELTTVHSTSLNVSAFSCSATHDGWQVITSKLPFSTARVSYFEAKVQSNEDPKGGLAIGILGHMPKGIEVYQLKHKDGILYNSNNGVVLTDCCGMADFVQKVMFKEGSKIGVEYDPRDRTVKWFFNGSEIGTVALNVDFVEKMDRVWPCMALYCAGQKLEVDFKCKRVKKPPLTN